MGWYMYHLPDQQIVNIFSWSVVAVLSFELIYICYKALLGNISLQCLQYFQLNHVSLMGISISLMTVFTLYIGLLFFKHGLILEPGYLWGNTNRNPRFRGFLLSKEVSWEPKCLILLVVWMEARVFFAELEQGAW